MDARPQPNPSMFFAGVQIMSTLWTLGAETALPRLTHDDVAEFDQRLDRVLELGRENDPDRARNSSSLCITSWTSSSPPPGIPN